MLATARVLTSLVDPYKNDLMLPLPLSAIVFPLFRLNAAFVSAGIGSIFGWLIRFVLAPACIEQV